jgi:hypothetical protein
MKKTPALRLRRIGIALFDDARTELTAALERAEAAARRAKEEIARAANIASGA